MLGKGYKRNDVTDFETAYYKISSVFQDAALDEIQLAKNNGQEVNHQEITENLFSQWTDATQNKSAESDSFLKFLVHLAIQQAVKQALRLSKSE